jgi:hypothetical protein
MSDLHINSAPDRADEAEWDLDYLRDTVGWAVADLELMIFGIKENAPLNGGILLPKAARLQEIVTKLREAAGLPEKTKKQGV